MSHTSSFPKFPVNAAETERLLGAVLSAIEVRGAAGTRFYADALACGRRVVPVTWDSIGRYDATDSEPLTYFHSRTPPATPLVAIYQTLAARVDTYDDVTALMAAALVLRFERMTGLPLTSHMIHRLYLAALLVASKAHHDAVLRNKDFARVVGISVAELNRIESTLLRALDFRCHVKNSDVAQLATMLSVEQADDDEEDDEADGDAEVRGAVDDGRRTPQPRDGSRPTAICVETPYIAAEDPASTSASPLQQRTDQQQAHHRTDPSNSVTTADGLLLCQQ